MIITQEITVDVARKNAFNAIVAKQLDLNSRFLRIKLTDMGNKLFVNSNATALIDAQRPDNNAKSFKCVVNDDGTITAPLKHWMLELEGYVKCDIAIVDADNSKLTSTTFSLLVEKRVCECDTVTDDDGNDLIVTLINDVSVLKEDIENIKSNINNINTDVSDIRTGYDGTTYETAGEAVRAQVSGLNDALIEKTDALKGDLDSKFSVKESVNLWNPETTVIGQLQSDGSVRTSETDYVTTDYIPYKAGEQIWLCYYRKDTEEIVLVTPQVSNGSILCLYDKNKNFLARYYSKFHGIRGYTIDNPDCAYIRYTYAYAHWTNPVRKYCLSKVNIERVEDFEEYYAPIVSLKNVTDPSNPTKVSELENDEGYIRESEQLNARVVSCRGDSLTDGAGATSGNTYPKLLQDLLGGDYTVNNFGVGGDGTKGISWRFGATPIYLAPCTIPESGSVDCKIVDASGADVTFLLRGGTIPSNPSLANFNVNPVIIAGIEGVLARKSTTTNAYTFTRSESGASVTIDRPAFISTYGYRNNTKDITIFWCGTNDTQSWKGYTYIINYLKQMIDLLPHKNYIVCGLTCLNLHSDIATKNEKLSLEFGRHFLDLRYYLLNYGLSDSGITPTEEDEAAIASGEMPPSLLYDNVHFNSNGYAVIANYIYRKGVELGYW